MEKEFLPYEQALALKELGFNEPCVLYIQYSSGTDVFTGRKFKNSIWLGNDDAEINGKKIKYKFPKHSEQGYGTLYIPTFSQAFRWFRENHGLEHQITYAGVKGRYNAFTDDWIYDSEGKLKEFTYEEAELECLIRLIEIVKQ